MDNDKLLNCFIVEWLNGCLFVQYWYAVQVSDTTMMTWKTKVGIKKSHQSLLSIYTTCATPLLGGGKT